MRLLRCLPLLLGVPLAGVAAAQEADLQAVLASTPTDSLPAVLRNLETRATTASVAGRAAMVLGQLHIARGEYRAATAAFARAAARLDPEAKPEARYAQGLAFLGLGEATQARAALEEVAQTSVARRVDAWLGVAQAWELAKRPDRALETLEPLIHQPLGETGPAVLERYGALAERFHRPDDARRARERLLRDYPRSIEAASARLGLASTAEGPEGGSTAVVIGQFIDPGRARSLASEAKRSGFPNAQVVTRGEGLAAIHLVRLGTYSRLSEARAAGEQAAKALGVGYTVVRAE